jgi:pimeloyl-ACP methyl ester carboxylesterase
MQERRIALPNGRQIAFRDSGASPGRTVLYLHGFLGSRLESVPAQEIAKEFDLRLVSVDRPGFGLSSTAPPGAEFDAADAAAVCAELGLRNPIVVGVSGGSAAALLTAITPRVDAAVIVLASPLGPIDDPQMRQRFSLLTRSALRLSQTSPLTAQCVLNGPLRLLARRYPERLLRLMGTRFARADREVLDNPEWREAICRSLAESFVTGGAGALRDLQSYPQSWNDALWQVNTPVMLWHGRLDTVVPIRCARDLARRLPGGQLHEYETEGHLSVPLRHMRTLLSQAIRIAQAQCPQPV